MKVRSTLHFAKQKIVNIFNEKKQIQVFFYIKKQISHKKNTSYK